MEAAGAGAGDNMGGEPGARATERIRIDLGGMGFGNGAFIETTGDTAVVFITGIDTADDLVKKLGPEFSTNLQSAHSALSALSATDWTPTNLEATLKGLAEQSGKKLGDVMQPIRVALTGGTVSEPVNELLAAVERDESLARIDAARS